MVTFVYTLTTIWVSIATCWWCWRKWSSLTCETLCCRCCHAHHVCPNIVGHNLNINICVQKWIITRYQHTRNSSISMSNSFHVLCISLKIIGTAMTHIRIVPQLSSVANVALIRSDVSTIVAVFVCFEGTEGIYSGRLCCRLPFILYLMTVLNFRRPLDHFTQILIKLFDPSCKRPCFYAGRSM
jgi:hypothetical protein